MAVYQRKTKEEFVLQSRKDKFQDWDSIWNFENNLSDARESKINLTIRSEKNYRVVCNKIRV